MQSSRKRKFIEEKEITFNRSLPEIDECRLLIMKIVEQAVRDYITLERSSAPIDKVEFEGARDFLFDNDYTVDWGGVDKNLQDLLDILDIEAEWLREKARRAKERKIKKFNLKKLMELEDEEEG